MPYTGAATGLLPIGAGVTSSFAATLLVGALLVRSSASGALGLRPWGLAWIGLALQVGGAAILASSYAHGEGVFVLANLAHSLGTYGFLAGLIIGVLEVSRERPLPSPTRRGLLALAGLLVVGSIFGALRAGEFPFPALVLQHFLPLGACAAICSFAALRIGRNVPRLASGRWLVFVGLVLKASQALLAITGPAEPRGVIDPGDLTDVVILGVIGAGMFACLLDGDQEEMVRASAQMQRAASIDFLTGLLNKSAFVRQAGERLRNGSPSASSGGIVFLALSRLGTVNQSLGHAGGDRVLRASAERLKAALREGDELGRVGGADFAVLVADCAGREGALTVARKLQDVMRRPFEIEGREVAVTTNIGVSVHPDDALDPETLLDQACAAAHRVKGCVGSRVGMYSKGMNADALERLSLEHDLRHAIERDELILYYQPVFRLPSATIRGFEALLRWRHPKFGVIGADVIVPLAESTGLIHTIGPWVLRTACSMIEELRRQGQEELVLSANMSAHELMSTEMAERVEEALRQSGLPPVQLEIEVTETAAIDNIQVARDHLLSLKAMGVSVAIDDFGTGYSSLAYLRALPVDTIKIDRSFIRDVNVDIGDATLVTTIIALAQGRDLKVVAEGVETEDQLRFLIGRGCDYAQGYLLSRPVPCEELTSCGPFPFREAEGSRVSG